METDEVSAILAKFTADLTAERDRLANISPDLMEDGAMRDVTLPYPARVGLQVCEALLAKLAPGV